MADKKISELVDGGPPQATDEFVVDRAGADNFKLDWASLKTAAEADAVLDGDAAGGVLSGTYPDPGFAVDMATQAELDAVAASAVLDGDAAGGDLTGTFPNPALAAVGAAAGPVGDGTHVAAVTIDTKGRVTGLTSVAITGAAPTGAAGGDLEGTYPNPTLAVLGAATGPIGDATHVAAVTIDTKGRVTTLTAVPITGTPPGGAAGGVLDGTYPSPGLAAGVAGAGLAETADVLSVNVDGTTIEIAADTLGVKGGGIGTTQLANAGAGAAGPIGDATHVAAVTVDAKGRVTALSSIAITGTAPGGSAGGVLSGTYPNPGFAVDMATQAELDAVAAAKVSNSLFDANTVLAADTDDTPAALTMGASTILARLAAGNIKAATPAELRTLLALVVGTNVEAWDADLDAIAALTSAADKVPYATGAQAWALATLTSFARTLIDDADAATARTTLGVNPVDIMPQFGAGRYFANGIGTGNTNTTGGAEGQQAAFPILIPKAGTLDRIGIYVATTGSTNAVLRLGLYAFDVGYPGALIGDYGTVSGVGTGLKTITISQAVTAGWLFGSVAWQGAPSPNRASLNGLTANVYHPAVAVTTPFDGGYAGGFMKSSISGGFSNPFAGSETILTSNIPRLYLRYQ